MLSSIYVIYPIKSYSIYFIYFLFGMFIYLSFRNILITLMRLKLIKLMQKYLRENEATDEVFVFLDELQIIFDNAITKSELLFDLSKSLRLSKYLTEEQRIKLNY